MKFLPALLCVLPVLAQPGPDSTPNPVAGDPQAVENGRKTYVGSCAGCHGATGEGGRGPSLRDGRVIRRSTDAQMFATLQKGIAGTEMPGSNLADLKLWEIVAFVRALGAPAASTYVVGDPAKGERVYAANGCANCHQIQGRGGLLGPDLTNAGGTRSYEYLREAVIKPGDRILAGYQKAIAKTKDGRTIEGVCRNFTNYDVQIMDRDGKLYLLFTKDLADLQVMVATWMPPDYASRIGKEDLTDLLAYLSRLSLRPMNLTPTRGRRGQ